VRISFRDLAPGAALPGRIEVFDNTNQPVDWNDPANLRGSTANNANLHNRSYTNQGFLNVRRTLDFMPVPTAAAGRSAGEAGDAGHQSSGQRDVDVHGPRRRLDHDRAD
jgi:hypothetical protein